MMEIIIKPTKFVGNISQMDLRQISTTLHPMAKQLLCCFCCMPLGIL